MAKIMQIIAKETNGKSYNTEKYSFDTIGMPSFDYDDDGSKIMKWQVSGETTRHKKPVPLGDYARQLAGSPPVISYFLDGSRHAYKVDDISYNKQVYPVVAGQVGVGCCRRVDGVMHAEKFYRRLVLSLPNVCNADGWGDEEFFAAKTVKLNKSAELKRLGIEFSAILPYTMPKDKRKGKVEDSGIACIQDYMIQSEKEMVAELVKAGRINQNNYLLKDGSLEYKPMKTGRGDLRELQKIKHNYRWVIGVSKSFNPESILDHTGKPNANYIADLPLFHRTPVALYENKAFLGDVQFAVWYIRIRDEKLEKLKREQYVAEKKLTAAKHKEKRLENEIKRLTRSERTHRLCTRAGMLETFLREPTILTDDDVMELLTFIFHSEAVQKKLELLIENRKNVEQPNRS